MQEDTRNNPFGTWKPFKKFPIGTKDWNISDGFCRKDKTTATVPIKISLVTTNNPGAMFVEGWLVNPDVN
jgi:hypothetical protein